MLGGEEVGVAGGEGGEGECGQGSGQAEVMPELLTCHLYRSPGRACDRHPIRFGGWEGVDFGIRRGGRGCVGRVGLK
ncbi:hypothetical protein GCM10010372_19340 [Streptomyces tauricus]|nr:hypothetical protein GCM10010372_19340 [Streptomyces tauricus]